MVSFEESQKDLRCSVYIPSTEQGAPKPVLCQGHDQFPVLGLIPSPVQGGESHQLGQGVLRVQGPGDRGLSVSEAAGLPGCVGSGVRADWRASRSPGGWVREGVPGGQCTSPCPDESICLGPGQILPTLCLGSWSIRGSTVLRATERCLERS